MKFFNQKVSPVIAFLLVLAFGYFSIYFMNEVFERYAQEELLAELEAQSAQLAEIKRSIRQIHPN